MIDVSQSKELITEGLARDVIRVIQQTRKDINLEINDRIEAKVITKDDIFKDVIGDFGEYIKSQTLADTLKIDKEAKANSEFYELDGYKFSTAVIKK